MTDYRVKCNTKVLYDETFEVDKWIKQVPRLRFKEEWEVKIVPPFGGAIIRFWVFANGKRVSVYLDGYNMLGGEVNEPYWEIYDGEDIEQFAFGANERMMARIEEMLE